MSSARRPGGGGDGGRRGSRGGNATKKQSSTSAARALNVSLPSVAVVPASLEETHFAPLRAWLQRFWLRGQLLPAQLEVDRMVDIAAALCIQNYTAQFRSTVLHVHEGAFKVLAAAAHRNWRLQDDVALGSASAGAGGSGSDGRGRQDTNGSGDDGARARRLLAAARRDYVEAVRRLAVVGKVCAFHDGNHPRDSLAAKLVARLKHHLLEKDKAVAGTLRRLLGDPGDATTAAAAVVAWAECFPEPNAKALRVAPSDAHVAYDNAGNRHWEKKPPAPRAQLSLSPSSSPLSSPTARGSAGGDGIGGSNSISAKSPPPPLKPADAVVVSSGGGTLVTTTETKNACLPLLPGEVPVPPRDGGEDGNPDPGVGSGGGGGGDTAAAAGGSERGGGGGGGGGDGGGGASALTGADRAHVRLAGAELKLGETVTPYRENRAMHAELRYSDTAADELLEDGERTVERLRETIDDLADRILDVQTGTGIGDVRHWAPERLQRLQQLLALRAQKEEQLEAAESRAQAIDAQKEVRDTNLENVEYKLTALHGALRRSKKDRAFNFYKWRRRRNPGQFPDQVQQQLAARRAQQVYRPPQKAYNHFEVVQAAKERALRERRQALGILAADGETDGDDGKGAETAVAAGGGEAAAVSGGGGAATAGTSSTDFPARAAATATAAVALAAAVVSSGGGVGSPAPAVVVAAVACGASASAVAARGAFAFGTTAGGAHGGTTTTSDAAAAVGPPGGPTAGSDGAVAPGESAAVVEGGSGDRTTEVAGDRGEASAAAVPKQEGAEATAAAAVAAAAAAVAHGKARELGWQPTPQEQSGPGDNGPTDTGHSSGWLGDDGAVPATASISNGGSVLPAGKDDSEQLGHSDAAVSVAVTSTRNESVAATATPKESTSAVVVAAATETASEGDCVGGAEPKGASDGEGDNTHHTDAGEASERDAAHTEDPRAAAGDGGGGDDDDSDCSSDSFDARFL